MILVAGRACGRTLEGEDGYDMRPWTGLGTRRGGGQTLHGQRETGAERVTSEALDMRSSPVYVDPAIQGSG